MLTSSMFLNKFFPASASSSTHLTIDVFPVACGPWTSMCGALSSGPPRAASRAVSCGSLPGQRALRRRSAACALNVADGVVVDGIGTTIVGRPLRCFSSCSSASIAVNAAAARPLFLPVTAGGSSEARKTAAVAAVAAAAAALRGRFGRDITLNSFLFYLFLCFLIFFSIFFLPSSLQLHYMFAKKMKKDEKRF